MKLITRIKDKAFAVWAYLSRDVWSDTRDDWRIRVIKTLNLSVRSFLDSDLQSRAAGLTYRTILALVPALAILFAIGRGFGFHKLLQTQIFSYFPAQREALETTFGFVDAYLAQSSEGIFVGIGIMMLLWTMISLMNNIEYTFNTIWGIKRGRTLLRKITDYTSMLLILPVLMICASGLSIFMTSTLQNSFDFEFMSPLLSFLFKCASFIFTWLFFAAVFMLIPNTKVKFRNAFIAGVFSGTAFMILQWLFVSGQLYVSKYNAIYGSFSFLPLLLIWIQFSWVVVLSGIAICYSSQSIYRFNFSNKINEMSTDYRTKITLAIMCVIVRQFARGGKPITIDNLVNDYNFPPRIAMEITEQLIDANLLSRVIIEDDDDNEPGFQPAIDINRLSVAYMLNHLDNHGATGFVPHFDENFNAINTLLDDIETVISQKSNTTLIKDINIK